ncbi:TPA: hypothetical protein ACH3X3_000053 [Trebouxia sp. C0006]
MDQTGQLQELVFSTCQNIQVRGVYVGTLQEPFRTRYQGLRDWWHTSSDMRWLAAKRIRHHHTGRVDSTCTAIANNRPTLTKNVWIDSFPTNKHGMAWHGMTYYGADKSLVSRYNSLLFRIKFAVGGAERLLKLTGALNVNCTGGLLSH